MKRSVTILRWVALGAVLGVLLGLSDTPLIYIDTHDHLVAKRGRSGEWNFLDSAQSTLEIMDRLGIRKMLIMPQPFPSGHNRMYDYLDLLDVMRKHKERFGFLGGGGTLNPLIHESVESGVVTPAMRQEFETTAGDIARAGAVGFGEMAALHLSMNPQHPFLKAPPDHPLFLLLADLAAGYGLPIDLHMEAVVKGMTLTGRLARNNPKTMKPNIDAFERLLAHNPKAQIIWVHAGWDNTGQRTVALQKRLLGKYPNLYESIRVVPAEKHKESPVDKNGKIKPEWLSMIRKFPDRFMIGSDQFYPELGGRHKPARSDEATIAFLSQLPPEIAGRVGHDTARRVFNLNE